MPKLANPFMRCIVSAADMLKPRSSAKRAGSFSKDENGSIAVIFAIMLVPIILAVGAAVDYSRIALNRSEAQGALDAATLATVKKLALLNDNEARSMVEAYLAANLPSGANINIDRIEIERKPSGLKIFASGSTDTTFMRIGGINSVDFKANSSAVAPDKSIEVALVLDNSGSMGGSRIRGLKEAATSLVNILEENQQDPEDLSIGVVPFNHMVRMDEGREKAKWIDSKARSSLHRLNLPLKSNRLKLFKTLRNPYTGKSEEWGGCIEARKHPLDVKDTPASSSQGDSYFVPNFYPDTRERSVIKKNNDNIYLPYRGFVTGMTQSDKKHYGWYHKQTFKKGRGPNYHCSVTRLLPMTTNMNAVRNKISSMIAYGWTNIHMGTIWGLRLLSPQEPYSEGRSYSDGENAKFLIIMSDGENTFPNHPHAYGWKSDNRISGSSNPVREMNKRTLESCASAKSAGVVVYTIAYGNLGSSTTTMLKNCATTPENAFTPKNTSEMIAIFKEIAAALGAIRLTD